MRQYGVRSLHVYCLACHRKTVLDVNAYPDDVPVPSFGARMARTSCGMVGADAFGFVTSACWTKARRASDRVRSRSGLGENHRCRPLKRRALMVRSISTLGELKPPLPSDI